MIKELPNTVVLCETREEYDAVMRLVPAGFFGFTGFGYCGRWKHVPCYKGAGNLLSVTEVEEKQARVISLSDFLREQGIEGILKPEDVKAGEWLEVVKMFADGYGRFHAGERYMVRPSPTHYRHTICLAYPAGSTTLDGSYWWLEPENIPKLRKCSPPQAKATTEGQDYCSARPRLTTTMTADGFKVPKMSGVAHQEEEVRRVLFDKDGAPKSLCRRIIEAARKELQKDELPTTRVPKWVFEAKSGDWVMLTSSLRMEGKAFPCGATFEIGETDPHDPRACICLKTPNVPGTDGDWWFDERCANQMVMIAPPPKKPELEVGQDVVFTRNVPAREFGPAIQAGTIGTIKSKIAVCKAFDGLRMDYDVEFLGLVGGCKRVRIYSDSDPDCLAPWPRLPMPPASHGGVKVDPSEHTERLGIKRETSCGAAVAASAWKSNCRSTLNFDWIVNDDGSFTFKSGTTQSKRPRWVMKTDAEIAKLFFTSSTSFPHSLMDDAVRFFRRLKDAATLSKEEKKLRKIGFKDSCSGTWSDEAVQLYILTKMEQDGYEVLKEAIKLREQDLKDDEDEEDDE